MDLNGPVDPLGNPGFDFMGQNNSRRHHRVAMNLPAEIIVNMIDIVDGTLVNVSPGGLAVACAARVKVGDSMVVYVRDLDILPGRIVRLLPDGFAASLILSKPHRRKLTERLFLQMNPAYRDAVEERRATPRHSQGDQHSVCRLPDGSSLFVKIIDMSVNGAAVDARRKPEIGTSIRLAQRRGVVIRHTPRGFAIAFDDIRHQPDEHAQSGRVVEPDFTKRAQGNRER